MPLMGSLYIGTSGLQTGQNVLNTVAHNMTNVDTNGYTRQQSLLGTKMYNTVSVTPDAVSNQQYGLGVNYSAARQVRDYFLDKTYRRESGRSMFYEVSTEVMNEVENLLGELNGEDFQTSLSNLWTAVQELSKDPSSSVTQGLLVQRASEFIERATSVYADLANYQDNLNTQIYDYTTQINEMGHQIQELNDKIRLIESGGIEHANDLRDTRNLLLDKLSSLVKMSYSENALGDVDVQIEGVDFVKGGMVYEIALDVDATTGFYTPFWPQNANYTFRDDGTKVYDITHAKVFDLRQEIASTLNTDIGGMKARLLARGDHRADYSDIEKDYDAISSSIVMNIQAEFDQLIHNVSTKINEVLASAYNPTTGYMSDVDGRPIQLFKKITTEGYKQDSVTGQWNYVAEDLDKPETMYTLKNIQVNKSLLQEPGMFGFILEDGSVDYNTAESLKAAFTAENYTLNPYVQKKTNFVTYYTDLVSQVANSGAVYQSIYENQETTVQATYEAREQIVGVSTDEEISNMIKFQNAYNASSRYINVISEMLEHILNTLGV
ncbi:MAG: flagellar hook-associated protein FlgK [Lachnospiraceae bacterium]|nr:flagellar hook-associated protein FlgK [Lachnospiraceae bacterium]